MSWMYRLPSFHRLLPTIVSSHLVSRVSIHHAKVHLCPARPRFTRRRRRSSTEPALSSRFLSRIRRRKSAPSPVRRFLASFRRLTKRRINRRLSNAIIWLHDRVQSFDFPSILPILLLFPSHFVTLRFAFLRNDGCKMRCKTIDAIMQTNLLYYSIDRESLSINSVLSSISIISISNSCI